MLHTLLNSNGHLTAAWQWYGEAVNHAIDFQYLLCRKLNYANACLCGSLPSCQIAYLLMSAAYTIKNGACLWKYVVSLLRTDRKCKSAYGYHVTTKREELVLCKHTFRLLPSSVAPSGLRFMELKSADRGKLRKAFTGLQCFKELGLQWCNKRRRQKWCPTIYCRTLFKEVVSRESLTKPRTWLTNLDMRNIKPG